MFFSKNIKLFTYITLYLVIGFFVGFWLTKGLSVFDENFMQGVKFSKNQLPFSIVLLDRNGQEIHRIFDKENRIWTPIYKIPEALKVATVLAEDKRFYTHFGIDIYSIARAALRNYQAGRITQGASTLTQQIVRKSLLTDEQSFARKTKEALIAIGLEYKYNKSEILEMYINVVPYGPRLNGIDVASDFYFSKSPSILTIAECLILAILPQDPVRLSKKINIKDWLGHCTLDNQNCTPFSNAENYKKSRIEKLLFMMEAQQKWAPRNTKKIWEELNTIRLTAHRNWAYSDFQHWQFFIKNFLKSKGYDYEKLGNGIQIKTTLDSKLQSKITTYIRKEVIDNLWTKHSIGNLAVLILDNETRGPLVWIGSVDYWNDAISGKIDMLQAKRQIGSTMKPFIYAAMIDQGFQPPTILYDSPTRFKGDRKGINNSDGRFLGAIRMTKSLALSRNIPATKAFFLAGGETKVREYLDKHFSFGLKDFKNKFGWTLALGTAELKLSQVANAYATLGTLENQEICPIIEIRTMSDQLLPNPCDKNIHSVLSETTGFFLYEILSNIQARPKFVDWRKNLTIKGANLAVKTGTSSSPLIHGEIYPKNDLIIGYSPKVTIFIWGGNADGSNLKNGSVSIVALGSVWHAIAVEFFQNYPEKIAQWTNKPVGLKKINGEWATDDFVLPSYFPLKRILPSAPELRLK